jgi:hypothetical protein
MFGEYIPSGQGTVHDIYGNVRSSAVDGRSPYVTSNYGTVDTLRLQDGQKVRVSAVDGDSPYIVARNNPRINGDEPARVEADRAVQLRAALSRIDKLKEAKGELFKRHSDAQKALSSTRKYLYGSLALNLGLIAYCIFKR